MQRDRRWAVEADGRSEAMADGQQTSRRAKRAWKESVTTTIGYSCRLRAPGGDEGPQRWATGRALRGGGGTPASPKPEARRCVPSLDRADRGGPLPGEGQPGQTPVKANKRRSEERGLQGWSAAECAPGMLSDRCTQRLALPCGGRNAGGQAAAGHRIDGRGVCVCVKALLHTPRVLNSFALHSATGGPPENEGRSAAAGKIERVSSKLCLVHSGNHVVDQCSGTR